MPLSLREKFIILVDNDRLKKADVIILLEGDGTNRVSKAANLFSNGWGNKVLFSGGITDFNYGSYPSFYVLPELLKLGIPQEAIIVEDKSQNTREQSEIVLNIAQKNNWNRLLLVASHYHQYRAYLTFLKIIVDNKLKIELINATADNLSWFEKTAWGIRYELLDAEFQKIEKYSSLGQIATFEQAIEYQKWKEEQV